MTGKISFVAILAALAVTACSSVPAVTLVSNAPATDQNRDLKMSGVPFRVKASQLVRLFHWNAATRKYEEVLIQRQNLADMSRIYALDVDSKPFSSPTLVLSENADNTLKQMQVASTDNTSGAIDAVTGGITGFETARTTAATNANSAFAMLTKAQTDCTTALAALTAAATAPATASANVLIMQAKAEMDAASRAAGVPSTGCAAPG